FLAIGILALPRLAYGTSFTFQFDERGNGVLDVGFGSVSAFGMLQPDPTGGVAGAVLTYFLPDLVASGDVLVLESAEAPTLSDVVRFTNATGALDGSLNADRFIFYSDLPEPGEPPDLADTGFPTSFSTNRVFVPEQGLEGNNGFSFARSGNLFSGVSDAVPV